MIMLTQEIWKILIETNQEVNSYPYKTDMSFYHSPDFWAYIGPTGGDCEDYVLTKRKKLIEQGISPIDLIPAIGTVASGEGHCVLMINTDRGGYVLDIGTSRILPWRDSRVSIKKWYTHADVEKGVWVAFTSTGQPLKQ